MCREIQRGGERWIGGPTVSYSWFILKGSENRVRWRNMQRVISTDVHWHGVGCSEMRLWGRKWDEAKRQTVRPGYEADSDMRLWGRQWYEAMGQTERWGYETYSDMRLWGRRWDEAMRQTLRWGYKADSDMRLWGRQWGEAMRQTVLHWGDLRASGHGHRPRGGSSPQYTWTQSLRFGPGQLLNTGEPIAKASRLSWTSANWSQVKQPHE